MAGDHFAFDAYDRLVGRPSMAGSPVSLIVRDPRPESLAEILDRTLDLLAGRRSPDEVILAVRESPSRRPPSAMGRTTIRTVIHPRVAGKEGLEWLLANARWPLALFIGGNAELPAATFKMMLESLEHADIIVGRRRGRRGERNPLAWMVRRLFGVSIRDPLSPYIGLRREAFAGVPLELGEPLTTFELLAKATFSFAIYDEIDVAADETPDRSLHRVFRENWRSLRELFRNPTFWRYRAQGPIRTSPHETRPPRPTEIVGGCGKAAGLRHPLRRFFGRDPGVKVLRLAQSLQQLAKESLP